MTSPPLSQHPSPATDPSRLWVRFRIEILLFLFVVALVGPVVHDYGAQQASRYALSAAIWEEQTFRLDDYQEVLGIDRAVRDGHTYSDKAPLQPMLGVPVYAVYAAIGGESARMLRIEENLGLWWMTFWLAAVPLAVLAVLMHRLVRRYRVGALAAVLALVVGSMMLPFGSLLFGHMLAALLLFVALFLLSDDALRPITAIAAGSAAGAAVAVEYPAVIGVVVLAGMLVVTGRRHFGWFVVGGSPFAALLAGYHAAAFGSPFAHPYRYSAFLGVVEEASAPLSVFSSLHPERIVEVFFAGRGFAVAMPIVLIALYGTVALLRSSDRRERVLASVTLLMFAGYLGIVMLWTNPWGGESPGPRYMMPVMPFLALGAAVGWSRSVFLSRVAGIIGVVTMGLATFTNPIITREVGGGLGNWLDMARHGEFASTVFTIALGPAGWVVHGALVAWIGALLFRAGRIENAMQ